MYRPMLRALAASLCLVLLAGCGGSKLAQVSGKVTYKGQPLPQGSITFFPEKGREAHGKIKDGQIVEVTTLTLNDGAMVGPNRVAISAVANPGDMYASHESLIPKKYGDPNTSGQTADLKAGLNELSFELP